LAEEGGVYEIPGDNLDNPKDYHPSSTMFDIDWKMPEISTPIVTTTTTSTTTTLPDIDIWDVQMILGLVLTGGSILILIVIVYKIKRD